MKVYDVKKESEKRYKYDILNISIDWFEEEDIVRYTNEANGNNLHFILRDPEKIQELGDFLDIDLSNIDELDFAYYESYIVDYVNYGSPLLNLKETKMIMRQVSTALFNEIKDYNENLYIEEHEQNVALERSVRKIDERGGLRKSIKKNKCKGR